MKRLIPILFISLACNKSKPQQVVTPAGFEKTPQVIAIKNGLIPEVSGMADSKKIPGYLWTQQDSGNPPLIYLIKHDGTITDSVLIEGASNRDWEDMTLADGNIYVADIGDNNAQYPDYNIYRFPEPGLGEDRVAEPEKINFEYPDGSHDAEALLADPNTKDIYIITKRDAKSRVYKLSYPQSTTELMQAAFVGELSFTGAVSAALSPDGKEIIIKTYTQLYYYSKKAEESIAVALEKAPSTLDYQVEAQGEAVSFGIDNKGFFTLSEQALNIIPTLNYYKRK